MRRHSVGNVNAWTFEPRLESARSRPPVPTTHPGRPEQGRALSPFGPLRRTRTIQRGTVVGSGDFSYMPAEMSETTQRSTNFDLPGHIQRGDAAPWWNQGAHKFIFDTVPGRYIVLFFCSDDSVLPPSLAQQRRFSDAGKMCLFAISPHMAAAPDSDLEWVRFIHDAEGEVNRAYGVGHNDMWIVLDPMLRVLQTIPRRPDGADLRAISALLDLLPPPATFAGFAIPAPVLVLPNVFEPALCEHLIGCYDRYGGRESGFMREVNGKAVEMHDPAWKRRADFVLTDAALIAQIKARFARRVAPMLRRAFHFTLTRMERHLVGCYAANAAGHFGPHRDDTVKATEHRRFAVSINLNDGFAGGELSFPEYGSPPIKAPVGAAVIFSSSLLHRVNPVNTGKRYAFLPFMHDEEAERVRLANLEFLARQD